MKRWKHYQIVQLNIIEGITCKLANIIEIWFDSIFHVVADLKLWYMEPTKKNG